MLPELDWPQAVAAIGIAATVTAALVKVILSIYVPNAAESVGQREGKAQEIRDATEMRTDQIKRMERDIEGLQALVQKTLDRLYELGRTAGRSSEDTEKKP